jgi:hypothetical protein
MGEEKFASHAYCNCRTEAKARVRFLLVQGALRTFPLFLEISYSTSRLNIVFDDFGYGYFSL